MSSSLEPRNLGLALVRGLFVGLQCALAFTLCAGVGDLIFPGGRFEIACCFANTPVGWVHFVLSAGFYGLFGTPVLLMLGVWIASAVIFGLRRRLGPRALAIGLLASALGGLLLGGTAAAIAGMSMHV